MARERTKPAQDAATEEAADEQPSEVADAAVLSVDDPDAQAADAPAEVAADVPTFPKSRLIGADGELLTGHPAYVIAGALHDANDDDEFTAEQVDARIEAWLTRPVEVDNQAEEV